MSLEKCPECGGQLNTSARWCPHCGYMRVPKIALVIAIAGAILVLGVGAAFMMATPHH